MNVDWKFEMPTGYIVALKQIGKEGSLLVVNEDIYDP